MLKQFRHIEDRIRVGKTILVPGNITKECYSITAKTFRKIEQEVTIIIYATTNISF